MDWYHTWSIYGVMRTDSDSQFTASQDGSDAHYSEQLTGGIGQKRSLRSPKQLQSMSLEQLELDATDHLRRYRSQKQKEKRARSTSVATNVYHDGNFVIVKWIDHPSEETDDDDNDNHGDNDANTCKHLYVEVRIEEALSAVVIFCYYNPSSAALLDNFEFCLARGLRSSYETAFGWITSITDGLLHVSLAPLCFSSDHLSQLLSSWIVMEFQLSSKTSPLNGKETAKPMILTFKTPNSIAAAGLDTISLAVPPQALSNLYTSICETKPQDDSKTSPQLPLVRAIQCFIEDEFAIDVSTFPLIKIVTTFATIGADGRFKPTEQQSTYPRTLNDLRASVQNAKETIAMQSMPP